MPLGPRCLIYSNSSHNLPARNCPLPESLRLITIDLQSRMIQLVDGEALEQQREPRPWFHTRHRDPDRPVFGTYHPGDVRVYVGRNEQEARQVLEERGVLLSWPLLGRPFYPLTLPTGEPGNASFVRRLTEGNSQPSFLPTQPINVWVGSNDLTLVSHTFYPMCENSRLLPNQLYDSVFWNQAIL